MGLKSPPPPHSHVGEGRETGNECGKGGRGGKWLEVGLGFPPTSQKTKQNKKKTDDIERDRFYANQEKLNVDNLKRRKPMQTSIQKKKNKKRYAHIVIREQLRSLLVFPK